MSEHSDIREVIIAGLDWIDDIQPQPHGEYLRRLEGGEFTQPTDRLIRALLKVRANGRAGASGLTEEVLP